MGQGQGRPAAKASAVETTSHRFPRYMVLRTGYIYIIQEYICTYIRSYIGTYPASCRAQDEDEMSVRPSKRERLD